MKSTVRELEESSYEVIDLDALPLYRYEHRPDVVPRETIQDLIAAGGGAGEVTVRWLIQEEEDVPNSCQIYQREIHDFDHEHCLSFDQEDADDELAGHGVTWQPDLRF